MPKPYSLDLRECVARFVDSGQSRHTAATDFEVSVYAVRKRIMVSPSSFVLSKMKL
jgi:hypothetical protein